MKKSLSAPNLTSLASKHASVPATPCPTPMTKMKKSISTCALNSSFDPVAVLEAMAVEFQIESVIKVSSVQAGTCGLTLQKFPYEILDSDSDADKTREMALCLAEPAEKEEMRTFPRISPSTTYLELCETNELLQQRYLNHLNRIRKNKRQQQSKETPN